MMEQICIPLDDREAWHHALTGVPHAFAHTWENSRALYLTTGHPTYLYSFESDRVRAICPVAERTYDKHVDITTPYGFSGFSGEGPMGEVADPWRAFAKSRGYVCGYIGLHPMLCRPVPFDAEEVFDQNSIYVLHLRRSEDALFNALHTNRKRQLRSWDEIVSSLVLDRKLLRRFFLVHYHQFVRSRKASSVYHFSQHTLEYLTDLDNVMLVGAGHRGEIEAVSVFAHTPYGADYLFNVSIEGGQRHTSPLIWYAALHYRGLGLPYLNLGGGVREGDSLAEYKRRFGAEKVTMSCLKQVYDLARYERLCAEAGVDPNDMAGYFPPYRRRMSMPSAG